METKTCSRCGKELPITEFYPSPRYKGGYKCWCKACCSEAAVLAKRRSRVTQATDEKGGGTGRTMAKDKRNIDKRFEGIMSRELLLELKARGYKWDRMWIENTEVKTTKRFVTI